MRLFNYWQFWLKNWRFSINSCKGFIVSVRKKVLLANHAPYATKALKKAIMKRSYIENTISKKRQLNLWKSIRYIKVFVVDYIRRNAKNILIHLMSTKAQITKLFWKTSNLFFSEKKKFANEITLENSNENILFDDT